MSGNGNGKGLVLFMKFSQFSFCPCRELGHAHQCLDFSTLLPRTIPSQWVNIERQVSLLTPLLFHHCHTIHSLRHALAEEALDDDLLVDDPL